MFTVLFPLFFDRDFLPRQILRRTEMRLDGKSRSSTWSPNTSLQHRPVPVIVANRACHCPVTELTICRISSSVK